VRAPVSRRRRGKRKKLEKEEKETTRKRRRRSYTRRRREFDAEAWLKRNIEELAQNLGLDTLGLTREELIETLVKIVEELAGASTYIDVNTMVKRFRRYYDRIAPLIAANIAEVRAHMTKEQLEFVASNIGDFILIFAPKLYSEAKRLGYSEDLMQILQQQWIKAWINRRGTPIPPRCPKCGFNALTPDLTCLVCGVALSDKELKASPEFKYMFKEFIKRASTEELEYVLKAGYVILSAHEVKSPKEPRTKVDIEIFLSANEKEEIRKELSNRRESQNSSRAN